MVEISDKQKMLLQYVAKVRKCSAADLEQKEKQIGLSKNDEEYLLENRFLVRSYTAEIVPYYRIGPRGRQALAEITEGRIALAASIIAVVLSIATFVLTLISFIRPQRVEVLSLPASQSQSEQQGFREYQADSDTEGLPEYPEAPAEKETLEKTE